MAQTVSEAVQEPAGGRSKRSGRGGQRRAGAPENRPAIPLELLPLLVPHKKRGRLSVRVEQMPPLARLSAGRNNGDNSWSLASDELEDLTFQPPANFDAPHTLAIRIIVYAGGEASTAAIIDYEISPDGSGGAALPASATRDDKAADDGTAEQLQGLRNELAQTTALLAERDAALTAAKEESEAARADLVLAREAWQKELDARIAELEKDAARRTTEANAQTVRVTEAALAKAEAKWKADEATRLAAAQAKWRKDADAALADARAAADRGRAAGETELRTLKDELAGLRESVNARDAELSRARAAMKKIEADARATADRGRAGSETELRALKDELAGLRETLSARDSELSQARAAIKGTEAGAAKAQRDAILKAEETWKANEAARLAAAEARWRAQSEQALAEARSAKEQTGTEKQAEITRLREETAALQKRLTERDAEVTRLKASGTEADAKREQEQREALAAAEDRGKEQSARTVADLAARCARLDAELRAGTERSSGDKAEIERLREETATLHTRLAERDAEVTRLKASRTEADAKREQEQRDALAAAEERGKEQSARTVADLAVRCARLEAELQAGTEHSSADKAELARLREDCTTLRDTLAAREADLEHARAAAADTASVRQATPASDQIEAALAEATERYEVAEAALIDLRKRSTPQGGGDAERLRDEVATLQTILDQRDAELARVRPAAEKWYEYQNNGGAEPRHDTRRTTRRANNDNDEDAPRERGVLRDVVVVVAVVVAAILFYPRVVDSLPYEWQAMLPAFMTDGGSATYDAPLPGPSPSAAAAPPPAPASAEHASVISRGVNLRAGPSAKTDAITTLKAGTAVSKIEEHGGWVHVRVPAHDGEKEPRSGWVFNSYLKPANERATASPSPR